MLPVKATGPVHEYVPPTPAPLASKLMAEPRQIVFPPLLIAVTVGKGFITTATCEVAVQLLLSVTFTT